MMQKESHNKNAPDFSPGQEIITHLRRNLFEYMSVNHFTLQELAESAGISISTLNSIMYGNTKDCKISTVSALAKSMNISIDELVNVGTMPPVMTEAVRICRSLPEHSRYAIMWYIRHQESITKLQPKGAHIVSVMHPRTNNNGNLKISGVYSSIDISGIDKEVCRKIFWGIQLDIDFYMPLYSPFDILLIANDRKPTSAENSAILLDGNLFLAKRKIENGEAAYYSIRDGKFRVKESECDEVIGYIAHVIKKGAT